MSIIVGEGVTIDGCEFPVEASDPKVLGKAINEKSASFDDLEISVESTQVDDLVLVTLDNGRSVTCGVQQNLRTSQGFRQIGMIGDKRPFIACNEEGRIRWSKVKSISEPVDAKAYKLTISGESVVINGIVVG